MTYKLIYMAAVAASGIRRDQRSRTGIPGVSGSGVSAKSIRVIVASPGVGADITARIIGAKAGRRWRSR